MNLTEIIQSKNEGKTLSKIDEMRYNFITQRLDEEVYKGYIIAYHRTRDAKQFIDISNKIGFTTLGDGDGSMYGVGLYGNYTWRGVNSDYSRSRYGKYIIKYIVKPNNVIFFDKYTQLKVYGKKMSVIEQCEYWGMTLDNKTRDKIKKIDDKLLNEEINSYTSGYAFDFYKNVLLTVRDAVKSQFYGISYNGHNDRETILMYDFRNLTVLGYYDKDNTFYKIGNHNFYNIDTVSKNTIDNTNVDNLVVTKKYKTPEYILDKTKNKIEDINKNEKTSDIISNELTQQEKFNVFNKTHNINTDKLGYINDFVLTFLQNPNSYKVEATDGIRFRSSTNACIINDILLKTIPFQFLTSNQRVTIKDCDFEDLTFMFKSIYKNLYIDRCFELVSLKGIENMQFSKDNSYRKNFVELSNLPELQSLKYLPKSTRFLTLSDIPLVDLIPLLKNKNIFDLTISDCPSIKLNDGLPPNIQSIIYSNKSDTDIDLSLLNDYPNLAYAKINGITLSRNSLLVDLS